MRLLIAMAAASAALLAGCGAEDVALPGSGVAYRALDANGRLDAATACRDHRADAERGVARDQVRAVDPAALRKELDLTLAVKANRRRGFDRLCAEAVPFVTRGVEVTFDGATRGGDAFTYQTRSDKPLTIRGAVNPSAHGFVEARREFGTARPFRGELDRGRFVMPTVRLRKQANNSFVVAIHAPPNAPTSVRFSAICLDCLASG